MQKSYYFILGLFVMFSVLIAANVRNGGISAMIHCKC